MEGNNWNVLDSLNLGEEPKGPTPPENPEPDKPEAAAEPAPKKKRRGRQPKPVSRREPGGENTSPTPENQASSQVDEEARERRRKRANWNLREAAEGRVPRNAKRVDPDLVELRKDPIRVGGRETLDTSNEELRFGWSAGQFRERERAIDAEIEKRAASIEKRAASAKEAIERELAAIVEDSKKEAEELEKHVPPRRMLRDFEREVARKAGDGDSGTRPTTAEAEKPSARGETVWPPADAPETWLAASRLKKKGVPKEEIPGQIAPARRAGKRSAAIANAPIAAAPASAPIAPATLPPTPPTRPATPTAPVPTRAAPATPPPPPPPVTRPVAPPSPPKVTLRPTTPSESPDAVRRREEGSVGRNRTRVAQKIRADRSEDGYRGNRRAANQAEAAAMPKSREEVSDEISDSRSFDDLYAALRRKSPEIIGSTQIYGADDVIELVEAIRRGEPGIGAEHLTRTFGIRDAAMRLVAEERGQGEGAAEEADRAEVESLVANPPAREETGALEEAPLAAFPQERIARPARVANEPSALQALGAGALLLVKHPVDWAKGAWKRLTYESPYAGKDNPFKKARGPFYPLFWGFSWLWKTVGGVFGAKPPEKPKEEKKDK